MDKDEAEKKIRKAAEEGKITYAGTEGVESFGDAFVDEFLDRVCGVRGAWISDESSLTDFITFDKDEFEGEKEEAYAAIEKHYRVDVRGKDNLLEIFRIIHAQAKGVQ